MAALRLVPAPHRADEICDARNAELVSDRIGMLDPTDGLGAQQMIDLGAQHHKPMTQ